MIDVDGEPQIPRPGVFEPKYVDPTIKSAFGGGDQASMAPAAVNPPGVGGLPTSAIKLAKYMSGQTHATARSKLCEDKMKLWENDFRELVLGRLQKMFHPENFARMRLMPHLSSNLLQRIVNDTSILYSGKAKRTLVPGEVDSETVGSSQPDYTEDGLEGDDLEDIPSDDHPLDDDPDVKRLSKLITAPTVAPVNPSFDRLLKRLDWDVLLDTVEKLCSFLPTVWVGPRVVEGRLHFIIYTPDCADIVQNPNNPHEAIAFWYKGEEWDDRSEKMVPIIHFWEPTTYTKLKDDWTVISSDENPLGRLPVARFSIGTAVNKYHCDGIGNDLYEGTMELAILRTMQDCRVRDSAFKQIAMSGASAEDVPADQVMGGPSPIILGDQGTATVLDLTPAISQYTDLCRQRGLELAAKFGITSADYTSDKVPQSGFSKKLDQAKINKESRRRRKYFAQGEKDLYRLTAKTLIEYPVPDIGGLDPSFDLKVEFAETVFEEDPEKQNRIDAEEMKLGKTNIFEIWRRDRPDMTDMEILRQLKLNQLINQTFVSSEQATMLQLLSQEAAIEGVSKSGAKNGTGGSESGAGQTANAQAAGPGDAPNGGGPGGTAGE